MLFRAAQEPPMRSDPHSYNDFDQPEIASFDWKARVLFSERVLDCEVVLRLKGPGYGPLDLDTRDLAIAAVANQDGQPLPFHLGEPHPILGARLRIELGFGTRQIRIQYRTSPHASALQWLDPAQTAGGQQPFVFTQCQAIHCRSVVPLQDTPRVRVTYRAQLTVPKELRALVAAAAVSREERGAEAIETFEMPQSIPPYLFAFAVGELASRKLGERSAVWAEPSIVDKAAWEFAEVDPMIAAGEALYGPYPWDRFDILVMPPSFPYGGMENPRLTFLTPTLLAGDRSLVNVCYHELAHSWSGNLVTNTNAEHFWLNEGFTVYAERRILESLEGAEAAALHAALGARSLARDLKGFEARGQNALTLLKTELVDVDPDEAFSLVPYEKGYLLLRALEDAVGRDRFDAFLRSYLKAHAFQSITTTDFITAAEQQLPGALAGVHADRYLFQPGLPAEAPRTQSARLEELERLGATATVGSIAGLRDATEWQLVLSAIPRPAAPDLLSDLDARFHLSASGNAEVLAAWLVLAAESGWAPTVARTQQFLAQVGRMKFLKPLYEALAKRPETRGVARATFDELKPRYHPIAQRVIEGVLARLGA
jgi:aminopeptidase N